MGKHRDEEAFWIQTADNFTRIDHLRVGQVFVGERVDEDIDEVRIELLSRPGLEFSRQRHLKV